MATVTTTARVYCPLPSTVVVTPSASARVIVDDRDSGGAVIRVVSAEESFSVPAGGSIQIEAIGGDVTYTSTVSIEAPDGGVVALSEAAAVVALTATGTAFTGACEYAGFRVRAISGTPQTVTVYDATSATGTPIHTESVSATGFYPWASSLRRINGTGCHVVISGGASRTIDVLVQ